MTNLVSAFIFVNGINKDIINFSTYNFISILQSFTLSSPITS